MAISHKYVLLSMSVVNILIESENTNTQQYFLITAGFRSNRHCDRELQDEPSSLCILSNLIPVLLTSAKLDGLVCALACNLLFPCVYAREEWGEKTWENNWVQYEHQPRLHFVLLGFPSMRNCRQLDGDIHVHTPVNSCALCLFPAVGLITLSLVMNHWTAVFR